jgi:hypothetical protein
MLLSSHKEPPELLQAVLLQRLSIRSEVLLYVNDYNLAQEDWDALLDPPDSTKEESYSLTPDQTTAVMRTLRLAAEAISARTGILYDPCQDACSNALPDRNDESVDQRWAAKGLRCMIRHHLSAAEDIQELRVAVCGNVDAGKSTLLGVLTKGRLDDGRGRARIALLRHK